jgi:excinuclease ABC subunit C
VQRGPGKLSGFFLQKTFLLHTLEAVTKTDLTKLKLPSTPGVYFFLGSKKEILYIGKATSLKNRVRSYFDAKIKEIRSAVIEKMVLEAKSIEWTVTDSVLEALILESNLIRTHKPTYNTISKDDKSYNHLVITDEEFPRVLVMRGKDLTEQFIESEVKYHFGPFTSAGLFKEALKIIRKLFKFYDTNVAVGKERSKMAKGKIDFNRQIGLYPDQQSKKEYQRTIRHIRLFFEGKKGQIIKELEKEMMSLAKQELFEEANQIKRKIFALTHIQDIALLKNEVRTYRDDRRVRIEAYDIAHHQGKEMVGVMTVVESGEAMPSEYRKFKIQSVTGSNDPAALKEVLERRLGHPEWPFPQVIVVDGSTAQKNAAQFVLKKMDVVIPVVAVVKDDRHKPIRLIGAQKLLEQYKNDILLANAESHRFAITYHRQKSRKSQLL